MSKTQVHLQQENEVLREQIVALESERDSDRRDQVALRQTITKLAATLEKMRSLLMIFAPLTVIGGPHSLDGDLDKLADAITLPNTQMQEIKETNDLLDEDTWKRRNWGNECLVEIRATVKYGPGPNDWKVFTAAPAIYPGSLGAAEGELGPRFFALSWRAPTLDDLHGPYLANVSDETLLKALNLLSPYWHTASLRDQYLEMAREIFDKHILKLLIAGELGSTRVDQLNDDKRDPHSIDFDFFKKSAERTFNRMMQNKRTTFTSTPRKGRKSRREAI